MNEEWFGSMAGRVLIQNARTASGTTGGAESWSRCQDQWVELHCHPQLPSRIHGNDFSYPSCSDRLSRVSPDTPGKKNRC